MHSHNLTPALAEARVADLQRATNPAATAPPRRHRRYRRALAVLGLAGTAALAAGASTEALAQPPHDLRALAQTSSLAGATAAGPDTLTNRAASLRHAGRLAQTPQNLGSPDARDAAEGRGTFNSPPVIVVKAQPQTRPAPTNGIDWGDAGIGAGSLLAMSLLALGGTLFITRRKRAAHDTIAPAAR